MSKYQHAEWRISIYGRKPVEWDMLANWVCGNKLFSDNVTWLIQLPRLYNIYKDQGIIENFQQMLENIFQPLFECTRDPSKHPQLHIFLSHVSPPPPPPPNPPDLFSQRSRNSSIQILWHHSLDFSCGKMKRLVTEQLPFPSAGFVVSCFSSLFICQRGNCHGVCVCVVADMM